eukprot:4604643-Heterocapsa_arctica.AAC.1
MTTCHNSQCKNDLDDQTKFEWPPSPHGRMPQSAGSAVMYVCVKHFCAAFFALAMQRSESVQIGEP